jgi:hypothetical protein
VSIKADARANVPGALFSWAKQYGSHIDMSDLGINADARLELSYGYSRTILGNIRIGAKVKFLSFNLAKWSTTFDVFKVTLFEGSLAWTFTEESWGQLNAKWNTLMNEGSHKWWRANPEEVVVPYRIPEKGTNF